MRCPFSVRVSTLHATLTLLALCAVASCSGGTPGADGTTGGAPAPFGVQISQTYVTIENRTGAAVVEGQVQIIPVGVLPPFVSALPRLEVGGKRDLLLTSFRGSGTSFNRAIARARSVKITAKDLTGKAYEYEVPFN
jgi:hypothetical protein